MLRFCVNGGPGFIISAVGVGMMNRVEFGVVLFAAHLVAAFLLGVFSAPRGTRRKHSTARTISTPHLPPAAALVESVTTASETLLHIVGFVVLFAALQALVDASGVVEMLCATPYGARRLSALIACILEVNGGCVAAASLREHAAFVLGFAVGFGGLSVHCQIATSLRGLAVMDGSFFLARLTQGFLTALLTQVLLRWIPISQPVFGALGQPIVQASYGSMALSVALLVFGGIWMLCVGQCLDKAA